jgi:RimJ/RimL family protein N-acetyltransferase
MDSFHTTRLTAERLRARHLGELCRLHRDPRVMATLGGIRSDDETERFLRANLEHWNQFGYGLWLFRDKPAGAFVGRGGLRHVNVGGSAEVELAYALMAEFWGRGLATEMADAVLALGLDRFGLTDIAAFTLTTNRASRHVMEKAGLCYDRDILHGGLSHVLYRIAAESPRARR